jgi:hypothetical protein
MSTDDDKYNVYNEFDSNFVNYGELYKSPREMKQNAKFLINYYADALVKGPSPVYKDSPDLVGNRYFIDTHTKCLDKNDNSKTHPRSVLVDNVNSSALGTTNDNNSGLIYSLLASLKTIDSNDMFNDMSNNEPTEYINTSTDYLKDIKNPVLPLCNKITVFSDDKKETDISGWIVESDRRDIDPDAIKEGFLNVSDMMGGDTKGPDEWVEKAKSVNDAMQDQAEAVEEEASKSANDTISAAGAASDAGKQKASAISSSGSTSAASSISSQTKSTASAMKRANAQGMKKQLRSDAVRYLQVNKQPDAAVLLKTLMNTYYTCKGDVEKVAAKKTFSIADTSEYSRYNDMLKNGIPPSRVRVKMLGNGIEDPNIVTIPNPYNENADGIPILQQEVYAKYNDMLKDGVAPSAIELKMKEEDTGVLSKLNPQLIGIGVAGESTNNYANTSIGKQVRVPSICIYSIFEKNPTADIPSLDGGNSSKISVKNVFAGISNAINKNKENKKTLEVPGLPNKSAPFSSIQPMHGLPGSSTTIQTSALSENYKKMLSLLYKYRLEIAMEIVRYSSPDLAYGQCVPVAEKEGFTTMDSNDDYAPYISNWFVNYSAYLFMLAMIFLVFFIVYKYMFRLFRFNRWKIN